METSPKKNKTCPICNTSLNFLTRKVVCITCNLYICIPHSIPVDSSTHRCTLCEKSLIKSKNPDIALKLESLKSTLQSLSRSTYKLQNNILAQNDTINRLDKQLRSSAFSFQEKIEFLEKKISQEQQKSISEEMLIVHMKNSLEESQRSEKCVADKLNTLMMELHQTRTEFEEVNEDQKDCIVRIDKVYLELRGLVPISKLNLITCASCGRKIRHEFVEAYRAGSAIESKESLLSRVSLLANRPDKLKMNDSVCRTCNVI